MPIKVIATIKPNAVPVGTVPSPFPTVEDLDILGGYQVSATDVERNLIPDTNRKEGMLVYTVADTSFWQLNASPWNGTNSDWSALNFDGSVVLNGDVIGVADNVSVVKIQGNPIQAGILGPSDDGYVLTWNSDGYWTAEQAAISFTAGGDLSGTNTNQIVSGIEGKVLPTLADGYLNYNGSSWQFSTISSPSSLPPSGSAGGDLSGSYPNPNVAKINGTSVSATPTANQVLVATSGTTTIWEQISNAQINNAAAITVSKLASGTSGQVLLNSSTPTPTWTTISGDATVSNSGVITVSGSSGNFTVSGNLQVDGSETIIGPSTFQQSITLNGNLSIADGYTLSTAGELNIEGSVLSNVTTQTSSYVVDSQTIKDYVILCNFSVSGSVTLPMPTAGRTLLIKDISGNASTNNITVTHHSAETIDGNSSYTIVVNYETITVISNGTNWFIF